MDNCAPHTPEEYAASCMDALSLHHDADVNELAAWFSLAMRGSWIPRDLDQVAENARKEKSRGF